VTPVPAKIYPVDGATDHQASGSALRSSSLTVSASALNCVSHCS
jgi:hypothetical protein